MVQDKGLPIKSAYKSLTQKAIGQLFDVGRRVVTKHFNYVRVALSYKKIYAYLKPHVYALNARRPL